MMSATDSRSERSAQHPTLERLLREGLVTSVFQPIVDLQTGRVAAFEALARGPEGPWQSPAALFTAAREQDLLAELDLACGEAALRGAARNGLVAPATIFVNIEPEALEDAALRRLRELCDEVPGGLTVVLEITERALASRPAELLRSVERVRELGWGVALDDVGAEVASLAFMPLLRPDVVKLDLRLVQGRPTPAVAQIMNAVNAYAESTGALILAEGIENETHLETACGLGATLGQGWFFGRPTADPDISQVGAQLLLSRCVPVADSEFGSPFACLPAGTPLRTASKRLLVELSKQLEQEALRVGDTCVVASTFQQAQHFTPATAQRYRDLVERTFFVCAIGEDLPEQPVPGLRGASLQADDPVLGEWDVAVLGPHFSAALLARDLGDSGPDMQRRFEYALTYERDTVTAATRQLLSRVAPRVATPGETPAPTLDEVAGPAPAGRIASTGARASALLDQALATTSNGVCIADVTRPGQPLVYVNAAFAELAGYPEADLLGRNCRLLQTPETDRAAVGRLREAIAAGRECREVILNARGPDREPWWNEVTLSPVRDADGQVVQYIGVQNDVTARMQAERALAHETERARAYRDRIEELAHTDPLTGLWNRRRLEERVEVELWDARVRDGALALLLLDLDGFADVNDSHGRALGDEVLTVTAQRLSGSLRRSDFLARLGGDEFLVAVTGLHPSDAAERARDIADVLAAAVREPIHVGDSEVVVGGSVAISVFPDDGAEFGRLLRLAELRLYDLKHPGP